MILFWFLLGILFIIGVSRYNESERLFWQLFISFIGGFAAVVAVQTYIDNKKQDKVEYVTSAPTQVLYVGPYLYGILADSTSTVSQENISKPVSKDSLSYVSNIILSKVYALTRDQPTVQFDTS